MPTVSPHPLKVSLVQGATRWHDLAGNRDYYGALVRSLKGSSDLIVLRRKHSPAGSPTKPWAMPKPCKAKACAGCNNYPPTLVPL